MTNCRLADLGPPGSTVSAIAVDGKGTVLAQRNPDKVVAPASNVKLLTTAVALDCLAPDFRAATTVQSSGRIVNGHLYGNLRLVRGGAPDFDRADLQTLANAVGGRVDTVTGSLILDTALFEGAQYGPGRAWEDAEFAYGAPTTALSLGKNVVTLQVSVDENGDVSAVLEPPSPVIEPDISELTVEGEGSSEQTGPKRCSEERADHPTVRADPCDGLVRVVGSLSRGDEFETRVPVRQPIEQTKRVAAAALEDAGVTIDGVRVTGAKTRPGRDDTSLTELGATRSAPLSELLRTMNVESNNFVADTLARLVAAHETGAGSWSAWTDLVSEWLASLGVETGRITDGSGLSRYNRLSARAIVTVLRNVADSPWSETAFESLPEPGEGTLSDRLHDLPVRAKTGTLTDARALSGRVLLNGDPVYFSLLVDDITQADGSVRERQDDVVRALAGRDSHSTCGT